MSREDVATALDEAAEALARAAHALRGTEPPAPSGVPASVPTGPAVGAAGAPPPAAPLPPTRKLDDSAFTKCPAHDRDWTDGKFGPYCTGKEPDGTHDGNWYNDRGYCRVTPKSAVAWLKQHPEGPVLTDDELPF